MPRQENLTELKGELDVRLYAYCLMTNQCALIADACADGKSSLTVESPGGATDPLRQSRGGATERCGKDATNPVR